MKPCSIEGCSNPSRKKGWCNKHYMRWWNYGHTELNNRRAFKDKLEDYIIPVTETGCWLWTKGCDSCGYGQTQINGKTVNVHRAVWEVYNGPIPKGMYVLHKCDTPSCANPQHLFIGTQQDNIKDMHSKGRWKRKGPFKVTQKCPQTGRFVKEQVKS